MMDVKIESMIFGWDERIPDTLIKFINSVTLTKDEQELRGLMEVIRWNSPHLPLEVIGLNL